MTTQERIKADAIQSDTKNQNASYQHRTGFRDGYIAGATATHDRAKVLVDALELAYRKLNWIENSEERDIINKALEQWEGKGIINPCPHCGKELLRDRNLCCRECGKEVGDEDK